MRSAVIRLILAATFAAVGACGSAGVSPESSPGSVADNTAAASDPASSELYASGVFPEVSRTRDGDGGIIAIAGEMTMEFDYAPPQGHCQASDGKFAAKGIGIDNDQSGVSINYETIVAPDTGKIVGQVFLLEVRKDGYVPWAAQVGTGLAGSVEDISQDSAPGGGITLSVTGAVAGFQKNRAPTGIKTPFRLQATCEP
jgi:hypothetical protein